MRAVLTASGIVVTWALSGATFALPTSELLINSAEWMEPCSLPSATAAAPALSDAHLQLASCDCCTDFCCADACCPDPCCGDGCCPCSNECGDCVAAPMAAALAADSNWSVAVGAIFLHRSRPDPTPIVTRPLGTPGVLISGSDFGFGWDAGPDVSIMRRTASGLVLEGRYFNDRDANAEFQIPAITTFRIAGRTILIGGGDTLSLHNRYTTKLDSTELNVHAPVNSRCTLLAGFRWIELHDALRVDVNAFHFPLDSFTQWDEFNHMYGGQLGTNILLSDPASRLRMNVALKAGVYGNDADNRFKSTHVVDAQDGDMATSFVGELNFTAAYRVTQHVALRGGYEVLWLDNVALASEAAAGTTQIVGSTSSALNTDGRVWYNGATAGVEFLW